MDNRIQNPAGWSDQLFADIVNMDYYYGLKCCTCEKSHCLKHYCECFAAGLFCVESCACNDCGNILENKAKVLDRRENIESRNLPWILPFDHEVIQEINELPATKVPARTEDNNQSEIYSSVAANSDYTCSYSDFFTGGVYCKDSSSCEDLKVVSFPESIEDDLIELRKANEVLEIPENFECWNVLGLDPEVVSAAEISTGVNRTESDALVAADSDTCFTTSIVKSCNETMKISSKFSEARGTIKCTCKKDQCSKRNCECFAAGEYCLKSCACEDCNNIAEAREEIASSKCQCKENQCMKHSCGCFADRKYCTGNCGCQGCCNHPENEHKSVEARNAKERKGCKCCRSKCLRGRCWCHKERVGCSEACKCTGCENNYGQNPKRRYNNSDKSIR